MVSLYTILIPISLGGIGITCYNKYMKFIDNNMDPKGSGIYKITNTNTGKIYVGSSKCIHKRYLSHKRDLTKGVHGNDYLQCAFTKYGIETFLFEIIEMVEEPELILREQYYIETLKCCDKSIGYNIAPNAERPGELAQESRDKISAYRKANPWTPEQMAKSAASRKGLKKSQSSIDKMIKTNIERFSNMNDEQKKAYSKKMKELFSTEEHICRLRKQSDEINAKRMKVNNEYILSEIVLKYIACKSLVSTSAEFSMSKSALSRIFKRINGEFPIMYREILSKINFNGDSITDLQKTNIQSELTFYKRN